jgi:hypothetical protein
MEHSPHSVRGPKIPRALTPAEHANDNSDLFDFVSVYTNVLFHGSILLNGPQDLIW